MHDLMSLNIIKNMIPSNGVTSRIIHGKYNINVSIAEHRRQ